MQTQKHIWVRQDTGKVQNRKRRRRQKHPYEHRTGASYVPPRFCDICNKIRRFLFVLGSKTTALAPYTNFLPHFVFVHNLTCLRHRGIRTTIYLYMRATVYIFMCPFEIMSIQNTKKSGVLLRHSLVVNARLECVSILVVDHSPSVSAGLFSADSSSVLCSFFLKSPVTLAVAASTKANLTMPFL